MQRAILRAVDTMASDCHEVTAPGHGVTQDGQVAVVDIGAVKLNHTSQLFQQRVPGSLYAQHINGLNDVVAGCPGIVYAWHAHNLQFNSQSQRRSLMPVKEA